MWERGMTIDRAITPLSKDRAATSVTTEKIERKGQVQNLQDFK